MSQQQQQQLQQQQQQQQQSATSQPGRIFLFSLPRSACHLFEKMISAGQSNLLCKPHLWGNASYPILLQMLSSNTKLDDLEPELLQKLQQAREECGGPFYGHLAEAEKKGMTSGSHEHPFTLINPVDIFTHVHGSTSNQHTPTDFLVSSSSTQTDENTSCTSGLCLPDNLLLDKRNRFIITIRHPSLAITSQFRLARELNIAMTWIISKLGCSLFPSRTFYTWAVRHGLEVYIIDAEDYTSTSTDVSTGNTIHGPSPTIEKLCHLVGLNPDEIITAWPAATEEYIDKQSAITKVAQRDIHRSTGIRRRRDSNDGVVDVEELRKKWKDEFGNDLSGLAMETYGDMMLDYGYLYQRRLVV